MSPTHPAGRRPRTGAVFLAVVVCSALAYSTARAQDEEATANPDDEIARSLFQAGRIAFDAGQYDVAFESWSKAYNQSRRPALLYNLGLASDRLRRDDDALRYYKAYLREVPDTDNRAEVENRIRAIERAREERKATEAASPSVNLRTGPAPERTDDEPGLLGQWWFWTGAGVVVAAVVVGAIVIGGGESVSDPRPGTGGLVVVALSGP